MAMVNGRLGSMLATATLAIFANASSNTSDSPALNVALYGRQPKHGKKASKKQLRIGKQHRLKGLRP